MPGTLEGKCVFVTGGSRGLGKAIAIEAAKEGALVLFTYHENENEANQVLKTIIQSNGKAQRFRLALENPEQMEQVMSSVFQCYKVDILINNAAILIRKNVLNTSVDDFDTLYKANLRGPFILAQMMARHMIAMKTKGLIINISSDRSITMTDGIPAYQIMKAGLNMLTQVLARGLAKAHIRAISISPGVIKTDMHKHLWDQGPVFWQKRNAQIPLGAAVPEQIAKFIVTVASTNGDYVNGANLVIDGGRTVGIANEDTPDEKLLRAKL